MFSLYIEPLSYEVESRITELIESIRVCCHNFIGFPDFIPFVQSRFPAPFTRSGDIVSLPSPDARKLLLSEGVYASQPSFDDFLSRRLKPIPGFSFTNGILYFDLSVTNGLGFVTLSHPE